MKRPGKISYGVGSYGYDVRLGYKFKVFTPAYCTGAVIDPKEVDPKSFIEIDLTPFGHAFGSDGQCGACGYWQQPGVDQVSDPERCKGMNGQRADHIIIPPAGQGFVLGESLEHFEIPRDVLVVCVGKSTYARCGIIVNVTPGEPEWKGHWTIEISNTAPLPAKVYAGEGIMQCLFFRADGYREATDEAVSMLMSRLTTAEDETVREAATDAITAHHQSIEEAECEISYADKVGKYQDQKGLTLPKVD